MKLFQKPITVFLFFYLFISHTYSQFPTERHPQLWPFLQNSIWNMPIGSNAVYVDAGIGAATQGGMIIDEDIIILEPDAPLKDVVKHNAGWNSDLIRCDNIVEPIEVLFHQVPVPNTFFTDPNYEGLTPNHSAAILMSDKASIKQTQPFHVCHPNGELVSEFTFSDGHLLEGNGIRGAHGGSEMSSLGGTVRIGELVPGGVIRHALKIDIFTTPYLYYDENENTPGYRWPASRADEGAEELYQGTNPAMEMGALVALKPDFNINNLNTEPARILAQAFMDYGAYIVDDTAWDVYAIATEYGPNGRVKDEFLSVWGFPIVEADLNSSWSQDMRSIFMNLHVVNNNSTNNIGGGGTPRQPLAPPFIENYCNPLGTACDDRNPNTGNDEEDGNCNCIGTPINNNPCSANLVTNSSFEDDLNNWNTNGNEEVLIVDDAISGTKAARIGPSSSGITTQGQIPVTEGETYVLEFWTKEVNNPDSWAGMGIDFYDDNGMIIHDHGTQISNTEWDVKTLIATAPAQADHVIIWTSKSGSEGFLFIEDVCLQPQSALAIDWFNFELFAVEQALDLQWSANSPRLDHFEIWRSEDGLAFEQLDKIEINTTKQYHWKDQEVKSGQRYYYKIKAVESNGVISWSKTLSGQWFSQSEIQLFPNPTQHKFVIDLNDIATSELTVELFNTKGQLLKSSQMQDLDKQLIEINVTSVTKGLLLVKINTGKQVFIKKLMLF